jgi:hypothetical protein
MPDHFHRICPPRTKAVTLVLLHQRCRDSGARISDIDAS